MANTYIWLIESLDCILSLDGKSNVVSNVHWRVNATDEINKATIYGEQKLSYDSENQFIPFDSLTKETVIEWVQKAMGSEQVAFIQQNLDNQIANLANPPIVTPPLPWGNV